MKKWLIVKAKLSTFHHTGIDKKANFWYVIAQSDILLPRYRIPSEGTRERYLRPFTYLTFAGFGMFRNTGQFCP